MERKRIKVGYEDFKIYFFNYFEKLDQNQKNILLDTKKKIDHHDWMYSFQVLFNSSPKSIQTQTIWPKNIEEKKSLIKITNF